MNISHRVTPNIQVSVAWENVLVFRLSGAHLKRRRGNSRSAPTVMEGVVFFYPPCKGNLPVLLHDVVLVVVGQRPHQAKVPDLYFVG